MTFAFPRKTAIVLSVGLVLAAVIAAVGLNAPIAAAGSGCANSDAKPGQASQSEFRKAIVCLVNRERERRGRDEVGNDGDLKSVAQAHTKVMVRRDCFDHACPGEKSLERRIKNSGYAGNRPFSFEELVGYERTPSQMVNAWLNSASHRAVILDEDFEDIGAGAANGAPVERKPDGNFVTYTLIFGFVS